MLIFSEHITPRLQYVIRFIFDEFLGIKTEITSDRELFIKADLPKISYLSEKLTNEFNISPDGLLFESGIVDRNPDMQMWNGLPVLFAGSNPADLPFDIFAAAFFMLSRYEEYLPYKPDRYGRYPATESINLKNSFLEQAVVDRWIMKFVNLLKNKYPGLKPQNREFLFIPTIDVDMPYAYLYKGALRSIGGAIRSFLKMDFNKLNERFNVVTGKIQDPFYTFNKIKDLHANTEVIIFFLTAGYGRYDKGINPNKNAFKEMVNHASSFSHTGIHPSYYAYKDNALLNKELRTLSFITGGKITKSRQHFLKIHLPGTYNNLSAEGITEDYSMGYASHPGFRTGTCTPFYFYDLLNDRETSLTIYPFQIMDRTLKDYMHLSPGEAIEKIGKIVKEIREVQGTFITIWHNDSFSDSREWEGWLEVYKKLLQFAGA